MHDCYDSLSPAAMRNAVEFEGVRTSAPPAWRQRMQLMIENGVHPLLLRACGITPELLAYCGFTLEDLVERKISKRPGIVSIATADRVRYRLEHLIVGLELTFADLCLLGFALPMLRFVELYPLIVLYDHCEFRAVDLFNLDIGYADVQNFIIGVDQRYVQLLQLNLPWWQSALGITH